MEEWKKVSVGKKAGWMGAHVMCVRVCVGVSIYYMVADKEQMGYWPVLVCVSVCACLQSTHPSVLDRGRESRLV